MLALIILSLIPLAYTDFRFRYVHLWSVAFFLLAALGYLLVEKPVTAMELLLSYGLLLAMATLSLGITYIRLKKQHPLKDMAGSGDLLFLAAIPLLLPISQLLVYLIATCIAGLLHHLIAQKICSRRITIPLAGWGAVCLATFMLIQRVW